MTVEKEHNNESYYPEVLVEVIDWTERVRSSHEKIKVIDRNLDKSIFREGIVRTLEIFPVIDQEVNSLKYDSEIVFGDNPVKSFRNSPFARLHLHLQKLRHGLIIETFERMENFANVPFEIATKLNPAWRNVTQFDTSEIPQLNPEVIINLAKLPKSEVLTWARFVDGFSGAHEFLKRTLATKYHFSGSQSQGYNKRGLQLSDFMLTALDTIAGCTPWQMRWDKQDYLERVNHIIYGFISEKTGADKHIQEGRMWSDEVTDNPGIKKWIAALETGQLPEKIKS